MYAAKMLFIIFIGICLSMYLLHSFHFLTNYFIAIMLFDFAFGAAVVYITAVIANADRGGDFLALIGGAVGLGAAAGPVIAGFLVEGDDYTRVFILVVLGVLTSAVLALQSEKRSGHRDD